MRRLSPPLHVLTYWVLAVAVALGGGRLARLASAAQFGPTPSVPAVYGQGSAMLNPPYVDSPKLVCFGGFSPVMYPSSDCLWRTDVCALEN